MRLLFFGTPEFAVPTLEGLIAGPHDVVGVVSQPDRRRGRGRKTSASPVAARAEAAGLALFRPEKVGTREVAEQLRETQPDLGVVVAFGQFLPKRIRELPSRGYLINGHASLLPRHRGAAPIARAILEGDTETGVSVMRVEKEMDAGAVTAMKRTPIGERETCGELTERMGQLTAEAIGEALIEIAADRATWQDQAHELATLAPKIEREDARLVWSEPAAQLVLRIRAMAPKPGAFTEEDGQPLRILDADASEGVASAPPGTVQLQPDGFAVATGKGWLVPRVLQRAGGRPMDTATFLRGRAMVDGTRLGQDTGRAA